MPPPTEHRQSASARRFGAESAGTGVDSRDPDGSPMEFISYVGTQP
jgi:hypothetical protein